jgi:hypothetical protein
MSKLKLVKFLNFLQADLAISEDSVELALRNLQQYSPVLLPMLLWQYGLVDLSQLEQIFDWLDRTI